MKILCPIFVAQEILEVRGNGQRVVHYEHVDGKKVFTKHNVEMRTGNGNMGTEMGTEDAGMDFFMDFRGASGGIRTRDPRLTKAEPHRARLPRRRLSS